MNLQAEIIANAENPQALEMLYRQDPAAFQLVFPEVCKLLPDSVILAVWQARLANEPSQPQAALEPLHEPLNEPQSETTQLPQTPISHEQTPSAAHTWLTQDLKMAGLLAVLAGLCTRVLAYFAINQDIAPVNVLFGIVPFLAILFAQKASSSKNQRLVLALAIVLSGVYLNLLPLKSTDSIIMAYLHLPVFLWVVLGFAFTGPQYRTSEARLTFLKFNGEFAILYACLAICGMILTALTLMLFEISLPGIDVAKFYMENVVVVGAASMAVVAAYLVTLNLRLARSIAPFLARIFGPLVLLTLVVYLVTLIWAGKNPFLDRDFLIAFNGILLVVLAVTIFSLTESTPNSRWNLSDLMNAGLIILALAIDGVALASIVFRLSSFGLTPNRIAVLGVNLLIGIHLAWILVADLRVWRQKTGPATVQRALTQYLPAYGAWSAFVFLVFPWIFR